MSNSFSDRLQAIRIDKRQSQEEMAAFGGVSKRAQQNYESGERMPDVLYLQNMAVRFNQLKSPIDLAYLITGETAVPNDLLSDDELALVAAYRRAPKVGKEFILHASGLAANVTAKHVVQPAPDIDLVADYKANKVAVSEPAKSPKSRSKKG